MATQLHNEVIAAPPPVSRVAEFKKHLPSTKAAGAVPKKKLIRRIDRDYSQALRRGYQFAFLLMNVWLGGQFYLWVRHYETAGASAYVSRPAGVEGWLPIAGMMNFKYLLLTGRVPALHPAAMFLLMTFLAISFLFRKAFCSWLCPVGTISEYLWKLGEEDFRAQFSPAALARYSAARPEVLCCSDSSSGPCRSCRPRRSRRSCRARMASWPM